MTPDIKNPAYQILDPGVIPTARTQVIVWGDSDFTDVYGSSITASQQQTALTNAEHVQFMLDLTLGSLDSFSIYISGRYPLGNGDGKEFFEYGSAVPQNGKYLIKPIELNYEDSGRVAFLLPANYQIMKVEIQGNGASNAGSSARILLNTII